MPYKDTEPNETPQVNTFTAASARRLSDENLTFPEMYPHEVASFFGSDITEGLSVKRVKRMRSRYGDNTVDGDIPVGFVRSLKRQVSNLVPVFLVCSSLLFYVFQRDAAYLAVSGGILLITLINALLEFEAGKVLHGVKRMSAPKTAVRRDGRTFSIEGRGLVPGDIILLESGCVVPADARLIESSSLTVLETLVSGKSGVVTKDAQFLATSSRESVYANMVYAGTFVKSGTAVAVVCATGKDTLKNRRIERTPEKSLPAYLRLVLKAGRIASILAVLAELLLISAGLLFRVNLNDTFIAALAVGAAVLGDTAFSLSAYSMASGIKKAVTGGSVFRSLDSFDRVGKTDMIICDNHIAFPPKSITMDKVYDCTDIFDYNRANKARAHDIVRALLICSSIRERYKDNTRHEAGTGILKKKKNEPVYVAGDYTTALIKAAADVGYSVKEARDEFTYLTSQQDGFGETSRVLGFIDFKRCIILRGSPENVLARCAGYRRDGKNYRLDEKSRAKILASVIEMSGSCVPIAVAMGYTEYDTLSDPRVEKRLVFLGIAGFYTSVAVDTASALYKCGQAGINVSVFSDAPYYKSFNLSKTIGLVGDESEICTGEMIHSTDEGLFIADNERYRLFTDITAEDALYVLRLRRSGGHKVAVAASNMDEIALAREADVSFATKAGGNEAMLVACDVQLTAGGFDSLVTAITQAKLITKRIADTCQYIFCSFFMLFFWMLMSVGIRGTIPFGVQDVFIFGMLMNVVLAASVALAPESRRMLSERRHGLTPASIVKGLAMSAVYSALGAALCIVTEVAVPEKGASLITYASLLYLFSLMTGRSRSVFTNRFYRNYGHLIAFAVTGGITAALLTVPFLRNLFGYSPVSPAGALFALGIAAAYFLVIQLAMLLIDRRATRNKAEREAENLVSGDKTPENTKESEETKE